MQLKNIISSKPCVFLLLSLLLGLVATSCVGGEPVADIPLPAQTFSPSFASWRIVDNPNTHIDEIDFVSLTEGWGISSGQVVSTHDGGQTWVVKRSPSLTSTPFKNLKVSRDALMIQFFSASEGWVLEGDTLVGTKNGGATWEASNFKDAIIRSFYFLDRKTGWAVGEKRLNATDGDRGWRGCVYATDDGGRLWREVTLRVDVQYSWALFDVWAATSKDVWVVGDLILHSADAGHTWKQVDLNGELYGRTTNVGFSDAEHGWITTNQGNNFCITRDGGLSWQVRTFPKMKGGVAKLVQTDAFTLWVVGQDGVYKSSDEGIDWQRVLSGSFLTAQHFAEDGILIVAGDRIAFHKL